MKMHFILVTIIIFAALSVVFFVLKTYAPEFRFAVLETGNAIMAGLSLLSYYIVKKQVKGRPYAFVRGVYSASFLKMMVCMVSVLVYVLLNRQHIHKSGIFVLFGIYIIYTTAETLLLSKLVRS